MPAIFDGRPHEGTGHMMGYGNYGGMFMWLILIILAGVVIYFILNRGRRSGTPAEPKQESPVEILKRRYANGEISKEEFDRIKKDLES
jgi:putative membrane protein